MEDTSRRDYYAKERTHLANERTFLSYVRTSISLIVLGVAILQFLDFATYGVFATASLVSGIAILVFGAWRYWGKRGKISTH